MPGGRSRRPAPPVQQQLERAMDDNFFGATGRGGGGRGGASARVDSMNFASLPGTRSKSRPRRGGGGGGKGALFGRDGDGRRTIQKPSNVNDTLYEDAEYKASCGTRAGASPPPRGGRE